MTAPPRRVVWLILLLSLVAIGIWLLIHDSEARPQKPVQLVNSEAAKDGSSAESRVSITRPKSATTTPVAPSLLSLSITDGARGIAGASVVSSHEPRVTRKASPVGRVDLHYVAGDRRSIVIRAFATGFAEREQSFTSDEIPVGIHTIVLSPLIRTTGRLVWFSGAPANGIDCEAWLLSKSAAARFASSRDEELTAMRSNQPLPRYTQTKGAGDLR